MSSQEPLPISEVIEVLDHETIYKTQKWWCEVVRGKSFGRVQILYYLWIKQNDGKWKRKQKATFPKGASWEKLKSVVERFQKVE